MVTRLSCVPIALAVLAALPGPAAGG